jgi:putative endonuclease
VTRQRTRRGRSLQRAGLRQQERNYRVGAHPSRRTGEVEGILLDRNGTLVLVEVRGREPALRTATRPANKTTRMQQRLFDATEHHLLRHATASSCSFDAVAPVGHVLTGLQAAFYAG